MIVPHIENPAMIDIGRPDIFDDSGHEYWSNVHKFIKETNMKIMVNGAFHWIDAELASKDFRYAGGGFHYCFWFENQDRVEIFLDYMKHNA